MTDVHTARVIESGWPWLRRICCVAALVGLSSAFLLALPEGAKGGSGNGQSTTEAPAQNAVAETRRQKAQERLVLPTLRRATAKRALARPPDGLRDWYGSGYQLVSEQLCGTRICVHWVPATVDAPPLADADGDAVPDWIESSLATLEEFWSTYHDVFGYRETLTDDNDDDHPDGRLDVFFGDIGADGFYGYAATDDPNLFERFYPGFNVSAFIVLDNDFAAAQFDEGASGFDAFRVAAAHELFHAFQFAYDIAEDNWFAQAGASWVEDEVADDVNLNRVWLPFSAMGRPDVPLDFGDGPFQYANWIFFRYLSERFGRDIIRDAWALADGSPEGLDLYSIQAIKKAVRMRGARFPEVFADFGAANRAPAQSYEEGAAYPTAPEERSYALGRVRAAVGWTATTLDHLTNQYVEFVPGRKLPRAAKLRVDVRLTNRAWARAALLVHAQNGEARLWRLAVDRSGRASRRVPFDPAQVASVDLVLTNASVVYRCWQFFDFTDEGLVELPFACYGVPIHDDLLYRFRARVVR